MAPRVKTPAAVVAPAPAIVTEVTNAPALSPAAAATLAAVTAEQLSAVSAAAYRSGTADRHAIAAVVTAGNSKATRDAYYAGRVGATCAAVTLSEADAIAYGTAVLAKAGAGTQDAKGRELRTAKEEREYGNARTAWNRILTLAGLKEKKAAATVNAAGLSVISDKAEAKAAKETAAEKSSKTITSVVTGIQAVLLSAAVSGVLIEKNAEYMPSEVRAAHAAYLSALNFSLKKYTAAV